MLPIPPLQVTVTPENSCNHWMCCFKGKPQEDKESPVSMEIVETVTRTYEKHRHSHSPGGSPTQVNKVIDLTKKKEPEGK